jgi:hypothetical protein
VQTFGIIATKRSGTLRGSCGENSIPDFWRPVVFDAKLSEFELTFPDPMHEFNAGNGDRGALKALQSEHWTQTKFDRPVILLDQIVIWHVYPCNNAPKECDTSRDRVQKAFLAEHLRRPHREPNRLFQR